jgi:hypothetical protein
VELELCEELLEDDDEAEELLEEDEELDEELQELDEELLLLLEELEEELEEELDDDTELEEELEDELEDELLETELELLLLLEELDEELDEELEELDEELDEELEELEELDEELDRGIHLLTSYLFSLILVEIGLIPVHFSGSIGYAPRRQHVIQLASLVATSYIVFPLQLPLVVKDPSPHPVSTPVPHCRHMFWVSFPLHRFSMYSPTSQLGHCVHPAVVLKPTDCPLQTCRST